MNLPSFVVYAIESGQRQATVEELSQFSTLYGINMEELVHGKISDTVETKMFM